MTSGYETVFGPDRLPQTPERIQSDVTWSSGGINRREVPFYRVSQFGFHKRLPAFPLHLLLLIFLRYLS